MPGGVGGLLSRGERRMTADSDRGGRPGGVIPIGSRSAGLRAGRRNRHLPILSWLLLVMAMVWLIHDGLKQSSEHGRRVKAFSQALRLIPEHYVADVDEQELYEAAMMGMLGRLQDPHSAFLDEATLRDTDVQIRGQYGGIGVTMHPRDGEPIIVEVMEGPAKEAGVRRGDIIASVGGENCDGKTLDQVADRIRGEPGTKVALGLRRAETGRLETIEIERALITLDNVTWEMIEPGIGYVTIRHFDMRCYEKVREAVEALNADGDGLEALLLDVRNNGGGLLDQAREVSDMFLSEGVICELDSRLPAERVTFEADESVLVPAELPVVILVNHASASAAEVVAGTLQGNGRAVLVGTRTFGKGAVNRLYRLSDQAGLMLTVAHYKVPPDRVIEGKGIEPDVKVGELAPFPEQDDHGAWEKWSADYVAAGEEQLAAAVRLLKEKTQ